MISAIKTHVIYDLARITSSYEEESDEGGVDEGGSAPAEGGGPAKDGGGRKQYAHLPIDSIFFSQQWEW